MQPESSPPDSRPYPAEKVVLSHFGDFMTKLGYTLFFVAPYITDPPYLKFTKTKDDITIVVEVYTTMQQMDVDIERKRPEKMNLKWLVPIVKLLAVLLSPIIFLVLAVVHFLKKWPWASQNIINWRNKDGKLHYLVFPPDRFNLKMVAHFYDDVPLPYKWSEATPDSVVAAQVNFIIQHMRPLLEGGEWLKKKRR